MSYADDITVYVSGVSIPTMVTQLNSYLPAITNHLNSLSLALSAAKSSVTLLTPDNHEHKIHPQVAINNNLIPLVKNPKILGVTFDPSLSFKMHASVTAAKVQKRNNVLKTLCSTSWGPQKETLQTTYNAIGKSVLNYAAPVWTPNLSTSNFGLLQRAQNTALKM